MKEVNRSWNSMVVETKEGLRPV